jgi:hypothetical protein
MLGKGQQDFVFIEVYIVRGEPVQNRLTHQILIYCQHFKDLNQTFPVSRRAEQLVSVTETILS